MTVFESQLNKNLFLNIKWGYMTYLCASEIFAQMFKINYNIVSKTSVLNTIVSMDGKTQINEENHMPPENKIKSTSN